MPPVRVKWSIGKFQLEVLHPNTCSSVAQICNPPLFQSPKETTFTAHLSIFVQSKVILSEFEGSWLVGMKYEGIRHGRVVIKLLKVLDIMAV